MKLRTAATACLLALAATAPMASAVAPDDPGSAQKKSGEKEWSVSVTPYIWFAGLDGSVGLGGLPPQAVGLSFGDIANNLEIAFFGSLEARWRRFGLLFDAGYTRIGSNVSISTNPFFSQLRATSTTGFGTAALSYAFEPEPRLLIAPYLGARWWDVTNTFEFQPAGPQLGFGFEAEFSQTWADFVAGVDLDYAITERWFIDATADVGGGSSDVTWQVYGAVGYKFTDWFGLSVGYRFLGVDYSNGGFVYDVLNQGLLMGFRFDF